MPTFFSPFGNGSAPKSPYGSSNVNAAGTAASDLFSGFGDIDKMKADELESGQYQEAAQFAGQEEQYTKESTAIKEAQQNRELTQAMGRTMAEVAGAGFAASGSALDIMRSNAQQGALAQAVTSQQGLITQQGYLEQQQSYETMTTTAADAAKAANTSAIGSFAAAGISAVASLVP